MTTRKSRVVPRPLAQTLESRHLLSAGGNIDTSFGQNGYLNGYRAEALLGGSIIAQKYSDGSQVLSTPDGKNVAPYSGPIPQPPPQNVQSDGKYLILANGKLTRFNPNGTVDTTFGQNGTVFNFGNGNPDETFVPEGLLVTGAKIFLPGELKPASFGSYPAMERLNPNGSVDLAFGDNGRAVDFDTGGSAPNDYTFIRLGRDGELYTDWDMDDAPGIIRFSQTGAIDGTYSVSLDATFFDSVYDIKFQSDGKPLVLAAVNENNVSLIRLNHDMTPDPTFGQNGSVQIHPQFGIDVVDSQQGALLLRSDGEIFAGIGDLDQSPDFTVAIKPDFPANSATVSGRFFNDLNSNRKQEKNEPGLAYWQAYADLNNNGIDDANEPSGFADVAGNYSIHGLKPGTYVIREVRQDGWTRTTPAGAWPLGFYKVTVKANQTVTGLNFGNSNPNHAKGSISGTFFNDLNGDQIQDNGEPALAGWQAYADMNNNGVFDAGEPIATADKNGRYTITGLVQGGYVVREIRRNGWSRTTPAGAWPLGYYAVALTPGEKAVGKNFGNVHASSAVVSVTGRVINDTNSNDHLDPGETGKAGVYVALFNQSHPTIAWLITTTAADGSFAFTNLAPGTYSLFLSDDSTGWSASTSDFTLLPAQSFHQNFFDNTAG